MVRDTVDTIRSLVSLTLLTIGVIIILMGAIRGFDVPVFQYVFGDTLPEEQFPAVIGLGTAFTFVAVWLQQRPFERFFSFIKRK